MLQAARPQQLSGPFARSPDCPAVTSVESSRSRGRRARVTLSVLLPFPPRSPTDVSVSAVHRLPAPRRRPQLRVRRGTCFPFSVLPLLFPGLNPLILLLSFAILVLPHSVSPARLVARQRPPGRRHLVFRRQVVVSGVRSDARSPTAALVRCSTRILALLSSSPYSSGIPKVLWTFLGLHESPAGTIGTMHHYGSDVGSSIIIIVVVVVAHPTSQPTKQPTPACLPACLPAAAATTCRPPAARILVAKERVSWDYSLHKPDIYSTTVCVR